MRPTSTGLEGHLAAIRTLIEKARPRVVIVDPITNLISTSGTYDVKSMLMRLIDFLKVEQITSMFTNLSSAGDPQELTTAAVSSLMDTWIVLRDDHSLGRRSRELYVLKSRGMEHSREHRELIVSEKGLELGIVLEVRRRPPPSEAQAESRRPSNASRPPGAGSEHRYDEADNTEAPPHEGEPRRVLPVAALHRRPYPEFHRGDCQPQEDL